MSQTDGYVNWEELLFGLLFQQELANASGICLSSAVRASVHNLLDELGGEGWTPQNYNYNKKKNLTLLHL